MLEGQITINLKHILPNEDKPYSFKEAKKRYFLRRFGQNKNWREKILTRRGFAVFLSLALPISVSAGLTLSGIFSKASASDQISKENLQNMRLLAANTSTGGSDKTTTNIVDDSAVGLEDGPAAGDPNSNKPGSDQINIYVVRPGDTISQIAKMFDVSVNTIKWGNNLTSNTLHTGETLVILPVTGVKHTVAKGDTLASIAKLYKGDQDEIANYNGLDKSVPLALGSIIIIPDGEITAVSGGGTYTGSYVSSGLKEYVGYYLRPIAGGRRTQGLHGHNAVDLGAPVGTPIMASADGDVIIARAGGWNGGYGSYVVIRHDNGSQTLYAHMSSVSSYAGESVKQGQVIGYVGTTGKATGPHVHFEIRGAVNPF